METEKIKLKKIVDARVMFDNTPDTESPFIITATAGMNDTGVTSFESGTVAMKNADTGLASTEVANFYAYSGSPLNVNFMDFTSTQPTDVLAAIMDFMNNVKNDGVGISGLN